MISVFKPKICLLLGLLVVTGFAGRPSFETISGSERRFLSHSLKQTRTNLLKNVKGLSEEQLNFKPAPDKWSVKECIQHLAIAEHEMWQKTEAAINQPTSKNNLNKTKTTDEDILKNVTSKMHPIQSSEIFLSKKARQTTSQALNDFKRSRSKLINFVRSTTDDLREHVNITPSDTTDAYQMILMISAYTDWHTLQIEEVKKSRGFPETHTYTNN